MTLQIISFLSLFFKTIFAKLAACRESFCLSFFKPGLPVILTKPALFVHNIFQ